MTGPLKLLARLREAIRVRHYSPRTEAAYVAWVRRFVWFHAAGARADRKLVWKVFGTQAPEKLQDAKRTVVARRECQPCAAWVLRLEATVRLASCNFSGSRCLY